MARPVVVQLGMGAMKPRKPRRRRCASMIARCSGFTWGMHSSTSSFHAEGRGGADDRHALGIEWFELARGLALDGGEDHGEVVQGQGLGTVEAQAEERLGGRARASTSTQGAPSVSVSAILSDLPAGTIRRGLSAVTSNQG